MKNVTFFLFIVFIFTGSYSFAQTGGATSWIPENPDPGDTITIIYDPSIGIITSFDKVVKLHWGINKWAYGKWYEPPEYMWPEGTVVFTAGVSVQSPMTLNAENKWEITINTPDSIRTLDFVITDGSKWDKSPGGLDWEIDFVGGGPITPTHEDTLTFDVLVDMAESITKRGFDLNDTLECHVGFFTTAAEPTPVVIPLQREGFSTLYSGSGQVISTIDDTLDYKYKHIKNGKTYDEIFYNFFYTGEVTGEAQCRQVIVSSPVTAVADTLDNTSDVHRMPFFQNVAVISRDVKVTFTCDVRPAIEQLKRTNVILEDIQSTVDITHPDSVLKKGVAINGPATGSWSNDIGTDWGQHLMTLDNKRMWDDGTHGDAVAGDSIYSIQFDFYKDSLDIIGQEFKFGIGGGDNEGGFGNNHIANIDDSQPTATIHAQFGSIDPLFYNKWDYTKQRPTKVKALSNNTPRVFELAQNYPNPFNPVTSINYALRQKSRVELVVYNLLGKKIVTLVDLDQNAGSYQVTWDGTDLHGSQAASGVYFYKIVAGDFVDMKKMVLIR